MQSTQLVCDGCGQAADLEHSARRLKRLEKMTRFRPVHVQSLFLGAVSPNEDADHLYSAEGEFRGEGAALLRALRIDPAGRSVEATLIEFQRRGYLFTHLLECPGPWNDAAKRAALERRLSTTMARIRRSFKPRRIILVGEELDAFVSRFQREDLGAEVVVPETGRAYRMPELETVCGVTAVTAAGA